MSIGDRIPLDKAKTAAAWLCQRWGVHPPDCAVVGSIRRGAPTCGDIDLLAPIPEHGKPDHLYQNIAWTMGVKQDGEDKASLFGAPEREPNKNPMKGEVLNGLRPYFKGCAVRLANPSTGRSMQVNVGRYVPGSKGNRGWKELMMTGPQEFGIDVLAAWKRVCGTEGTPKPGSIDGFLCDGMGNIRATPTEVHVFYLARMIALPPERRDINNILCIDWLRPGSQPMLRSRAHNAMKSLGYGHADEVFDDWKLQSLAVAGSVDSPVLARQPDAV